MTGTNPILESVERDFGWLRDHVPRHHAAEQPPAVAPVNLAAATAAAATKENPMSLLDTLRTDVADVEAKLKGLDETALTKVSTVLANPETADVLNDLNGLASVVGIPSGVIAGMATGLKTLLGLYAPDPAQAAGMQQAQETVAPAPVPAQ